jgi:hypothetical protein
MAKIVALQDFSWAHDHVRIVEYKTGETIDTEDQDLIDVSANEGWAAEEGSKEAKKAKAGAPENKDAGNPPENK